MTTDKRPALIWQARDQILYCQGDWTQKTLAESPSLPALTSQKKIIIDGSKLTHLDSSGALFLQQLFQSLRGYATIELKNFSEPAQRLLHLIEVHLPDLVPLPPTPPPSALSRLGKHSVENCRIGISFFTLFGEMMWYLWQWCKKPSRILWRLILRTTEITGYHAVGIVGLLSFLIGIVLAYQMGVQLQTYGANIFIVNLVGLSVLREFSPLLTAIIIAGRSGAAFTAEIGTMRLNQEIDALYTLGISPVEYLLLPKIVGLLIALPLLTVWSSIAGIFGGMLMAKSMLGIGFIDFILRFKETIAVKQFILGMFKTPFFAVIIASIGCFQGMQVSGSADSVGKRTTQSVVQAIFLIICADAFFSVLYSWYDL